MMNKTMPMPLLLVALVGALLLSVCGLVFLGEEDARTSRQVQSSPTEELLVENASRSTNKRTAVAGKNVSLELGHSPGRRLSYGMKLQRRWTLRNPFGEDKGQVRPGAQVLAAKLHATDYPSDESRLMTGYRLSDVSMRVSGPEASSELSEHVGAELDQLQAESPGDVVVVRDDRGQHERLLFPPSMDFFTQTQLVAVLDSLQLVLPEKAQDRWQTDESDMTGRFRAQYEITSVDDSEVTIVKTRGLYESLHAQRPSKRYVDRQGEAPSKGRTEVRILRQGGIVESLVFVGATSVPDMGLLMELELELTLLEQETDTVVASLSTEELQQHLSRLVPSAQGALPGIEQRAEQSRWTRLVELAEGHGVLELAMSLASILEKSGDQRDDIQEAVKRMAAVIATNEAGAAEAQNLIREPSFTNRCRSLIANALGNAGTESAQQALAVLVEERSLPMDLRASCLVSFAPVEELAWVGERALRDLVSRGEPELSLNAMLMIGHTIYRLAPRDPQRASDLTRFLLDFENAFSTTRETRAYLEALGNSGSAEAYGVVEGALASSVPSIRATAIYALRRMTDPAVEDHLSWALEDESPPVQVVALKVMALRETSPLLIERLGHTVLVDENPKVRRVAIDYLGGLPSSNSRSLSLQRVSREDVDPILRRLADSYL